MLIKSLFDRSKDILRRQRDKVFTYGAAADRREVRLHLATTALTLDVAKAVAVFKSTLSLIAVAGTIARDSCRDRQDRAGSCKTTLVILISAGDDYGCRPNRKLCHAV
jgi:hypothetical protein